MPTRTIPRVRAAAVIAATVAMAAAGLGLPAEASTVPDGGEALVLLDAGDAAHRVLLPGTPAEGMSGRATKVTTTTGTIVATGSQNESATIDGADYAWTGEFTTEPQASFKGKFGGNRYFGSFHLKEKPLQTARRDR